MRVAILVSHPIQYFAPVYRALAVMPGIDLTVLYRTRLGVETYHDAGFGREIRWDIPLLDGYRSRFLSRGLRLDRFEPRIVRELVRGRFDILLVHGYNSPTNLLAMGVAKLLGTRVAVRGDTRLQPRHQDTRWRGAVKRALFSLVDGFIAIGSLNRAYYLAHGVPAERIHFAPFCVDNATFGLDDAARDRCRQAWRQEQGIPDDAVVILFAAKFTERKRPLDLVLAYERLARSHPGVWLILAGAGPLEQALRERVAALNAPRVRFLGFQNQSALPAIYAAADIFVLPSAGEPWGLTVNEAMAAGLPVVVTDEVGAAPDLVADKGTGIVYRCGDIDALWKGLAELAASAPLRQRQGQAARALIDAWGISQSAEAIAAALRQVHGRGERRIP